MQNLFSGARIEETKEKSENWAKLPHLEPETSSCMNGIKLGDFHYGLKFHKTSSEVDSVWRSEGDVVPGGGGVALEEEERNMGIGFVV